MLFAAVMGGTSSLESAAFGYNCLKFGSKEVRDDLVVEASLRAVLPLLFISAILLSR